MGAAKGPAKCQETVESDSLVRAVQLSEEDEDGSATTTTTSTTTQL